jgi:hypothetical protein
MTAESTGTAAGRIGSSALLRHLPVLVPLALFGAHAIMFGGWLIDDAGISFAYARNVVHGHGLVSQPGLPPVEGYSNFLWVLLVALLYGARVFALPWAAKALAGVLVAVAFFVTWRALAAAAPWGGRAATGGLVLVSLQTAFVVWTMSGMENPLTVLLASLLLAMGLQVLSDGPSYRSGWLGGIVAGLLAWTRPDGIVFAAAYPTWLAMNALARHPRHPGALARALVPYLGGLVPLLAILEVFRLWYFGDLVPNTYYAKGGPSLRTILDLFWLREPLLGKLLDLSQSVVGWRPRVWGLVAVLGATAWLGGRRALGPVHGALGVMLVAATAVYLLLPSDWMGEYRFATAFYLFFYLFAASLLAAAVEMAFGRPVVRAAVFWAGAVMLAGFTIVLTAPRSAAFAHAPTVPLVRVAENYGQRFERLGAVLGIDVPSLLAPSIGGPLLRARVRIYDLGMLCDRRIALAIGPASRQRNQAAFYDYVFDEARPTFISTAVYYTWLARLDDDPRFRRDYVPIAEHLDRWVLAEHGVERFSGDYVRRDALGGRPEVLARLQAANVRRR